MRIGAFEKVSQQKTLSLFDEADFAENRVKPKGTQGGLRDYPAQTEETTHVELDRYLAKRKA